MSSIPHYENMSMQYIEMFSSVKFEKKNHQKKFYIFAQNIDRGYTLEPPL